MTGTTDTTEISRLLLLAADRRDQGDPAAAVDMLVPAAERWPECAFVHLHLGLCYNALDQPAHAERAFRRSLALERQPYTLSFLAHALRRQNRYAESADCLRAALAIDANDEEAHYNLGCHLRFEGQLDAAIDHLQRASDIDADYAAAHAELGFALMLQARRGGSDRNGDLQRALRHLQRSVQLDPRYHWSRLYLGNLLWTLKRIRQARPHYEAAVRLRPDDGFVLSCSADFLSSQFPASRLAESRFKTAVQMAPDDPHIHYEYGRHLLRSERYGEARRELLLAERLGHERAREALSNGTYNSMPRTSTERAIRARTRSER